MRRWTAWPPTIGGASGCETGERGPSPKMARFSTPRPRPRESFGHARSNGSRPGCASRHNARELAVDDRFAQLLEQRHDRLRNGQIAADFDPDLEAEIKEQLDEAEECLRLIERVRKADV